MQHLSKHNHQLVFPKPLAVTETGPNCFLSFFRKKFQIIFKKDSKPKFGHSLKKQGNTWIFDYLFLFWLPPRYRLRNSNTFILDQDSRTAIGKRGI